jgi:hypothetical protein
MLSHDAQQDPEHPSLDGRGALGQHPEVRQAPIGHKENALHHVVNRGSVDTQLLRTAQDVLHVLVVELPERLGGGRFRPSGIVGSSHWRKFATRLKSTNECTRDGAERARCAGAREIRVPVGLADEGFVTSAIPGRSPWGTPEGVGLRGVVFIAMPRGHCRANMKMDRLAPGHCSAKGAARLIFSWLGMRAVTPPSLVSRRGVSWRTL